MLYLKENYKSFLAYLGIFFVLFMGSGLVKIPVGSVWFYVIKFGIIAAVLGIGVSTWWKAKKNNEPPTDYLKLALFVPFTIDFHLHYAFIFLTIILFNKKLLLPWNRPFKPIYLLFIWGFISYVINQFIEFNPLSFPLFVGTFFLPFAAFGLFYNFTMDEINEELKTFFKNVVFIMAVIVFAQAYFLRYEHPDYFSGGTQNAHIAASFMTIAFMMALYRKVFKAVGSYISYIQDSLLLLVVPILLFFMDAKLFIVLVIFLTIIFTFTKIVKTNKYRIIFALVFMLVFSYWYFFTARPLPISLLVAELKWYKLDIITKNYFQKPKGRLITEIKNIPGEDPLRFILGSGPGTFNSRAAFLKQKINGQKKHIGFGGNYEAISIENHKIFEPYETRIQKQYANILNAPENKHGSLYERKSTLLTIFYELGLIGFMIFLLFFYLLVKSSDRQEQCKKIVLITLASSTLFISYFSFWLELLDFSIINYAFMGMYSIKKSIEN